MVSKKVVASTMTPSITVALLPGPPCTAPLSVRRPAGRRRVDSEREWRGALRHAAGPGHALWPPAGIRGGVAGGPVDGVVGDLLPAGFAEGEVRALGELLVVGDGLG